MNRRFLAIGATIAIVAIIAIALRATRDAEPAPSADRAATSPPPTVVATREPPRAIHVPAQPYPTGGTAGLSTDDPLTAYRKANVYPPGSRPLTRENTDLLHPGHRYEQFRPTDADDGITFRFTADRYFGFGDDVITSTLEVTNAPHVAITQALVAVVAPGSTPVAIDYTDHGGVWTAKLQPATLRLSRQAAIGMYIEFDAGHGRQRAHYDFQYTPATGVPARFTGAFTDAVVDGSLVIRAALDVSAPGMYVLDCNLYDANGEPVAWTHYKGDLTAGMHDAELVFFGKVIVDANARGPFHIGELRGARFVPGRDPDLEQIPPYPGIYTTRPYATSDFSDAEYDSADKQRMLQLLSEQQARGVHQGAAGGHGQPGNPGDDH